MFSATHIGREHVRIGRNNQDGHFASPSVIVVTDGCGSQPNSEVGAQLGARFLGEWLSAQSSIDEGTAERAMTALCEFVASAARAMGGEFRAVLERYFLFTVQAAVRLGERVLVFGLGDGAVLMDDRLVRFASFDNAPYYCAYRLTSDAKQPAELHHFGPASRVAVMSDGLGTLDPVRLRAMIDLDALKNPLTLQRRLNVLSETERFTDDATIAVLP